MEIFNNSTKNNAAFAIEKNGWYIVFEKVALGPVSGSLSFWSGGICTGLIGKNDAKEALQLMRDLEVKIIGERADANEATQSEGE